MTELEIRERRQNIYVNMLENRGTQKESRDHQSVWIIDTTECLVSFPILRQHFLNFKQISCNNRWMKGVESMMCHVI